MSWLAGGSGVPLCSWTITVWWSSSSLSYSGNCVMSRLASDSGMSLCSWTITIWWSSSSLSYCRNCVMSWLASGSGVPLCSWTITVWWSSSSLFQSRNCVMSWLASGVGVSLCSWTLTIWWGTYGLLEAGTVWCPGWLVVLVYGNKHLMLYDSATVWCDEMMFGDTSIGITMVFGGTCMCLVQVQVKFKSRNLTFIKAGMLSQSCGYISSRKILVMIKPLSLSILIWESLGDLSLLGKEGRAGRKSFIFFWVW